MIHPLAIATDGLLTLQGINTLAIATEGYLAPAAVEIVEDGSRWAGEWLPLPVPKQYQPPIPPKRKAKIRAKGPAPRGRTVARVIQPVKAHATCVVNARIASAIVCRVDNSIPNEEETIIAALAAFL